MNKFYELEISEVRKETRDAVTIMFKIPDEIKPEFEYKAGQYITIVIDFDGKEERRAYSISSAPFEENLSITIKTTNPDGVSDYLNTRIFPGAKLNIMPPEGRFTAEKDLIKNKSMIMFAGGSGITPLKSMIKQNLTEGNARKILLFYANRDENSIIFKNELECLQKEYNKKFEIIHFLSDPGNDYQHLKGKFTAELTVKSLKEYAEQDYIDAGYFLCGPPALMKIIISGLKELGIPDSQIHKESFVADDIETKENDNLLLKTRNVTINLYGEELEYEVEPDETILTAAMREGHEPPFSCQIGACSTCRAKLISGKVKMDESEALTDDEIESGYILSCQAHPLTDDVIVDYDI